MLSVFRYESPEGQAMMKQILSRAQFEIAGVQEKVDEIIARVRKEGDAALFAYTEQFDKVSLTAESIRVSQAEIEQAYQEVDAELLSVIRRAAKRIRTFHRKQLRNSWIEPDANGETLGQLIRPVDIAGVYVPGGKAAYPSSVLMNVIPAQVAGVKRIVMVSPCLNGKLVPSSIVSAVEAGVTEIYKVGGAQAIAALAFGTKSIPRVDKIVGPGNIYVAMAKRSVFGHVSIDSVAGPSEILILADETANPCFVAADMLSQAEHDELASAILVTTSRALAEDVSRELEVQLAQLPRQYIARKSLESYGAILYTNTMEQAVEASNAAAPEHLELCVAEPFALLPKIKHAGAIFMGNFSPEPLGDYMAGPNHVLPTGGTARFFSPLSVDDFVKKTSVISFSQEAFDALAQDVIAFAEAEGLGAHANSIRVRTHE